MRKLSTSEEATDDAIFQHKEREIILSWHMDDFLIHSKSDEAALYLPYEEDR